MLRRWPGGVVLAVAVAACSGSKGGAHPDAGGAPDSGGLPTSPTVTSVSPSSGPTDGGTAVTIAGTGFATGAVVNFGSAAATSVTVASATQITAVTPPSPAGAVAVEVINPDNRFGTAAAGFTYTTASSGNTAIGYCDLQFPIVTVGDAGAPLTLYGQVYVKGLTDSSTGQAPGIVMEAAIGTFDGGFAWNPTTFNKVSGHNDEFEWVTSYPAQLGTYASLFRAQLNGGPWSYCESDGGFGPTIAAADLGTVISALPGEPMVDWCNLQFPTSLTTNPGDPITFYGQVYKAGLTTQAGAAPGIVMQAGLAAADGGVWNWNATTFNVNVGNNDEFQWQTPAPAVGDYLTAFRASLDGGPWSYCETDGVHPALVPSAAGTLDVVSAPTQIGWCNLQYPTQASGTPDAPLTMYSRVYVMGVTDHPDQQGPGILVQIAIGDPDGGEAFAFTDAGFDANTDNGANDEFEVNITFPPRLGTYASVARAQINGGAWTYCEVDGPHATPDPAEYGSVTVVAPSPLTVDWCNLQYPTSVTTSPGDPLTFYGEVYKAGLTTEAGQAPGIAMQAGLASDGGEPTWVDAAYFVNVGNNDEYEWVTTAPAIGQYATAFRAALDGGPWTYCEVNGPSPSYVLQQAGSLSVVAPTPQAVTWCDLQFPTIATGAPGAPFTLYGQVYQPGVTNAVGQGPGIGMQAGIEALDGGWTWTAATYQSDQGNNDQYQLVTSDPAAVGTYGTAFRASLDGGPWSYCEVDGIHATLDPSELGSLTVEVSPPPEVGWCNLQYPISVTTTPSTALTLYGEVYVAGVTTQAGQAPGIAMQAGVSLTDGGWSWLDALFSSNQGNNDEYQASVTTPATDGTYLTAFRASLDGGPWSYCEADGLNATLDPTDAGTLIVASSTVGPVEWCNLQYPTQQTSQPGDSVTFYGWVYEAGLTDQAGNTGVGVYMELGIDAAPDAGWLWSSASFDQQTNGITPDANDQFAYVETAPAVGNYATVYRAALDGGPWSYCEVDGIHATLDTSETGQFTVVPPPPPPTVAWCNLQWPTQASGGPGTAVTLYGQVYQPGLTTQSGPAPGIVMQAGLSATDGGWAWNATTFNVNVGNNDEFEWQTAYPDAGSYLTAFRASLDGGPWVYCETDGEHPELVPADCGTLTVQ